MVKSKSMPVAARLLLILAVILASMLMAPSCEAQSPEQETGRVLEVLLEQVPAISGGKANILEVFPLGKENYRVYGVIVQGRLPEDPQVTGQEDLAFFVPAANTFIYGGSVFEFPGDKASLDERYAAMEPLNERYAAKLNPYILKGLNGLYQFADLAENKTGKTLFVFFDPWCSTSQLFYEGTMPQWFHDNGVQLVWVPISIFDGTEYAGSDFLSEKRWVPNVKSDKADKLPQVLGNIKRFLRLYKPENIDIPLFAWVSASNPDGIAYLAGPPFDEDARRIVEDIVPSGQKYDGPFMMHKGAEK